MSAPTVEQIQGHRHQVGTGSVGFSVASADVAFGVGGVYPIAIRVDTAGTVAFTALDGSTDTWTCVAGDMIPIAMQSVQRTGSSPGTGLHAIYAGRHGTT